MALLDAFEFLDSAWRNFFGLRLIERPSVGGVADLSQRVGSSAEFSTKMTRLDDLMQALRVDDQLPHTKAGRALPDTATVGRMHDALGHVLSGPDLASVRDALDVLSAANGIRVALQHKIDPRRRADLPTALARLSIDYCPTGRRLGKLCDVGWSMPLPSPDSPPPRQLASLCCQCCCLSSPEYAADSRALNQHSTPGNCRLR